MNRRKLLKLVNLWPPFMGAGIRVKSISEDFRTVEVSMNLKFWNRNYVGTHFGGSLYAMCDPFFMLILIENLGRGYIVWDKAATIRFKKPGKGRVHASFHIPKERIEDIRREADDGKKVEPQFVARVLDEHGAVVAEVDKLLYVKKKGGEAAPSRAWSGSDMPLDH